MLQLAVLAGDAAREARGEARARAPESRTRIPMHASLHGTVTPVGGDSRPLQTRQLVRHARTQTALFGKLVNSF